MKKISEKPGENRLFNYTKGIQFIHEVRLLAAVPFIQLHEGDSVYP